MVCQSIALFPSFIYVQVLLNTRYWLSNYGILQSVIPRDRYRYTNLLLIIYRNVIYRKHFKAHISLKCYYLVLHLLKCNYSGKWLWSHDHARELTVNWKQRGGACGFVGRHLDRGCVQIRRVVGGAWFRRASSWKRKAKPVHHQFIEQVESLCLYISVTCSSRLCVTPCSWLVVLPVVWECVFWERTGLLDCGGLWAFGEVLDDTEK